MTSPWTAPPSAVASLISKDGTVGVIVAGVTGGDNTAPKNAGALISTVVHDRDGVTVRAGGESAMMLQINQQSEKNDLKKIMEGVAIPLSFLVLVWVFGGLVAALLPLAVGACAIFGAMAVLHVITFATDVSIFALNLAVALGLALAIDYTLLLLSRFRDERAGGADRDAALMRMMVSAGRTVLFSAMTVALSMSAMVLFPPIYTLKSFGYAGVAVVAFASLAAIVVTPAAIVLLGDRLDSLDLRRWLRRPVAAARPVEDGPWYRVAMFSMRRALPIGGVAIVALLLLLGAPPFLGVRWGVPDDRVLPTSSSAHVVGDQLRTQFDADLAKNLTIVVPDLGGVGPAQLDDYAAALSEVPGVSSVSSPGVTFVGGKSVGPPTAATAIANGSAFLTVTSTAPLYSRASETQLDQLQAVPTPAGRPVLIGGTPSGQPRHRQRHRISTGGDGVGNHRRYHVRAAVLDDRQCRGAAKGSGAERFFVADGRIRCTGVDLPGRPSRRAGHDIDRHPGDQHSGPVVLHRLRAVDGLRGVPGFTHPGVLAGERKDRCRQRQKRRAGTRPYRTSDHRRSIDHGHHVCGALRCSGVFPADAGRRTDLGDPGGRHPRAGPTGACLHAHDGRFNWWAPKTLGSSA